MDRLRDRQAERGTEDQARSRQTDRLINRQAEGSDRRPGTKKTDRQAERVTEDKERRRQTDRLRDRQAERW
jgi:hypothetical protein